jgi:hypothetical protein
MLTSQQIYEVSTKKTDHFTFTAAYHLLQKQEGKNAIQDATP